MIRIAIQFSCHRLVATRQINDGKSCVCQSPVWCQQTVIIVRTAVGKTVFHFV